MRVLARSHVWSCALHPPRLQFKSLGLQLHGVKGPPGCVLKNVTGQFAASAMHAVMGPSGSGAAMDGLTRVLQCGGVRMTGHCRCACLALSPHHVRRQEQLPGSSDGPRALRRGGGLGRHDAPAARRCRGTELHPGTSQVSARVIVPGARAPVATCAAALHPNAAWCRCARRLITGWVPQDDLLHDTLSVQENLMYSARLRLSRFVGAAGKRSAAPCVVLCVVHPCLPRLAHQLQGHVVCGALGHRSAGAQAGGPLARGAQHRGQRGEARCG